MIWIEYDGAPPAIHFWPTQSHKFLDIRKPYHGSWGGG